MAAEGGAGRGVPPEPRRFRGSQSGACVGEASWCGRDRGGRAGGSDLGSKQGELRACAAAPRGSAGTGVAGARRSGSECACPLLSRGLTRYRVGVGHPGWSRVVEPLPGAASPPGAPSCSGRERLRRSSALSRCPGTHGSSRPGGSAPSLPGEHPAKTGLPLPRGALGCCGVRNAHSVPGGDEGQLIAGGTLLP